jgi:hypothetical protein
VHDKKNTYLRAFVLSDDILQFFKTFNFFWIMATLKEKFGKFELSKEQVKAVKGGAVYCFVLSQVNAQADNKVWQGTFYSLENAMDNFNSSEWNCCGYQPHCFRVREY